MALTNKYKAGHRHLNKLNESFWLWMVTLLNGLNSGILI
jgi:hypothetical protein